MQITTRMVREGAQGEFGIIWNSTTTRTNYGRRFRSHFGCCIFTARDFWNRLDSQVEELADPSNIVWLLTAFFFMKHYPTCQVIATRVGRDEKTVRTHLWIWIEYLSLLDLVGGFPRYVYFDINEAYNQLRQETRRSLTQSLQSYLLPEHTDIELSTDDDFDE